jgi:Ni/Co efflux regulator RcnB
MKTLSIPVRGAWLLCLAALVSTPALADKLGKAGKGHKHEQHEKYESYDDHHDAYDHDGGSDINVNVGVFFGDRQRTVVRDYYGEEYRGGHCPPGLAKKHNGCMPPGQAKKWRKGYPLPRDVIYYDLPPRIVVELGAPPAGHKYVRVAADILLIAVGTGMVVDAIDDLGNL